MEYFIRNEKIKSKVIKEWVLLFFLILGLLSPLFNYFLRLPLEPVSLVSPLSAVVILFFYKSNVVFNSFSRFIYIFLFLFLVGVIISVMSSGNISHLAQLAPFVLIPFVYFYIGTIISSKILYKSIVICVGVVFVFVITERAQIFLNFEAPFFTYVNEYFRLVSDNPVYGRANGIFGNPNTLGFFSGCLFFLVLALTINKNYKLRNFTLIMLVIMVFFSGSRGSLLGFLVGIIAFFYGLRIKNIKFSYFFYFLAIVLVGFIFLNVYSEYLFTYFTRFYEITNIQDSTNFVGRMGFWRSVMESDHVIFGTLAPPQLFFKHPLDSFFFHVIGQFGILGFVIIVGFFLGAFCFILNLKDRVVKFCFIGLLIFVVINSITMTSILASSLAPVFWLSFGFLNYNLRASYAGLIPSYEK